MDTKVETALRSVIDYERFGRKIQSSLDTLKTHVAESRSSKPEEQVFDDDVYVGASEIALNHSGQKEPATSAPAKPEYGPTELRIDLVPPGTSAAAFISHAAQHGEILPDQAIINLSNVGGERNARYFAVEALYAAVEGNKQSLPQGAMPGLKTKLCDVDDGVASVARTTLLAAYKNVLQGFHGLTTGVDSNHARLLREEMSELRTEQEQTPKGKKITN